MSMHAVPSPRLVECEPSDPITIHLQDFRASEGGWMRLALKNVAGDAGLTAVELRHTPAGGNASTPAESDW